MTILIGIAGVILAVAGISEYRQWVRTDPISKRLKRARGQRIVAASAVFLIGGIMIGISIGLQLALNIKR